MTSWRMRPVAELDLDRYRAELEEMGANAADVDAAVAEQARRQGPDTES